jgi:anti-sigma-K factor RskA
MTRDELSELAAGYALGALEGGARARFEALVRARDAEALRALRQCEESLARLTAESPETPPASVKAALLARIAAEPRAAGTAPGRVRPLAARPRRSVWTVMLTGALAAGIAAVAIGLAVSTQYERRLEALGRQAAELRTQVQRDQSLLAILRDPATQMVALSGQAPSPEARARMLWHEKAGGLLVAAGLPPAPAGKAYQLWAIAGTRPPVAAGVFTVDAQGTASLRVPPLPGVARVDAFAVTLEPAGGLPAPSGPLVLVGKS